MEDVFGTTIKAIRELSPELQFTISSKTDAQGNAIDAVDWDSLIIDNGDTHYVPATEEIETKRQEIVAALPLKRLREVRNRMLAETDWWVGQDKTPTTEQIAYRQALRDITNTYSSLDDVVWPVKPE